MAFFQTPPEVAHELECSKNSSIFDMCLMGWSIGRSCDQSLELCQGAEFDQLDEEDLDALFEEYGETVRNDAESNSVTSEVDEDSDSLSCESQYLSLSSCLSFVVCLYALCINENFYFLCSFD